jgi:hypothetical protein
MWADGSLHLIETKKRLDKFPFLAKLFRSGCALAKTLV